MPAPDDAFLKRLGITTWVNHHGTVRAPVREIWQIVNEDQRNSTLAGMRTTAARLQRLIAHCVEEGVRLRPMGSRWSFSECAVAEDGWSLQTDRLNYYFTVGPQSLDPLFHGDSANLVFVQTGCSIAEINRRIEALPQPRSLRTSGASNGQTIAGAIGTGTHGSAVDVGAIESQVAGIQLITSTRNIWIEHPTRAVFTAEFAARLDAELVRDAQLFSAALVNLGALGIVHAVLLETRPRYRLRSFLRKMPLAQIMPVMRSLDFTRALLPKPGQRPYFFQAVIDPANPETAYVTTRYEEQCPPGYVTDFSLRSSYEVGNDLPGFFGELLKVAPPLRQLVASAALRAELNPFENKLGTPAETYSYTKSQKGVAGASLSVPAPRIDDALAEAVTAFRAAPDAVAAFACRFAQASPAMLGWSRFAPSCLMDIDGIDTPATRKLMEMVRNRFDAAGIPYAQHWGKLHGLTKARLERSHGDRLADWHAVRESLMPSAAERYAFSTELLTRIGLHR